MDILVLGYGNSLRGDDDAGPQAAQAVADWNLPGVRTQVLHQLTPDLAEPLAKARAALFIDASSAGCEDVKVTALAAGVSSDLSTHTGSPQALLGLAVALYGHAPLAWWITIPAANFDLGAPLSVGTRRGVERALVEIRRLLVELG